MLHGDIGIGRPIPVSFMGDGMRRIAAIVLRIGAASGASLLIDEIENGIHYAALPRVWKAISAAANRFETQVFATTHSFECIMAAHNMFKESGEYRFRLHRLERIDGKIRAITYDEEILEATKDIGLEVR